MKHIHLSMQDLSQIVITEMSRGKSREDMVAYLRERGWPEEAARKFVANVSRQNLIRDPPMNRETPFADNDDRQIIQVLLLAAVIGLAMIAMLIGATD